MRVLPLAREWIEIEEKGRTAANGLRVLPLAREWIEITPFLPPVLQVEDRSPSCEGVD